MMDFPLTPRIPDWSGPGGSPRQWQQQFAEAAAWLQAWPADDKWMDWLTQPILLTQPLFGNALFALTGYEVDTVVSQTEAIGAGVSLPYQPKNGSGRQAKKPSSATVRANRLSSRASQNVQAEHKAEQQSKQHTTVLRQLPQQASRSLLNQLLPQAVTKSVSAPSSGSRSLEQFVVRENATSPLPATDTIVTNAYFQTVSRRLGRVLPDFARVMQTADSDERQGDEAVAQTADQNHGGWIRVTVTNAPWAQPVTGPKVTSTLLYRLLVSAKSRGQRQTPGFKQPQSRQPAFLAWEKDPDEATTAASIAADQDSKVLQGKPKEAVDLEDNNPKPGLSQTTVARPERIVPPQKAETLPVLDPTLDVPETPFSPATAVFERHQKKEFEHNQREADSSRLTESDLQSSIKRILDEEARRFGIDV